MLALRDQCVHPDTGKSYVKSIVGGRENSLEGLHVSHLAIPFPYTNHAQECLEMLRSGVMDDRNR